MPIVQTGDRATANVGTMNDVGRDQINVNMGRTEAQFLPVVDDNNTQNSTVGVMNERTGGLPKGLLKGKAVEGDWLKKLVGTEERQSVALAGTVKKDGEKKKSQQRR